MGDVGGSRGGGGGGLVADPGPSRGGAPSGGSATVAGASAPSVSGRDPAVPLRILPLARFKPPPPHR